MSYSIGAKGATKAECVEAAKNELSKVLDYQPEHAQDIEQAKAAAQAFVEALPDVPEGKMVSVSVYGSISWSGEDKRAHYISCTVNASFVDP